MMTHELYINDVLMDLEKDANIYLQYQSPLFTDLRSIISNRSNSVSLPMTPNNARAMCFYNLADTADSGSDPYTFPRRWHKVRYYRNGIPICEYGRGVITSFEGDQVKFTFYWGNIDNFQYMFDKKLNELSFMTTVPWGVNTPYASSPDVNYGFFDIDFCGERKKNPEHQHPCVSTDYILKQIAADSGLNIRTIVDGKRKIDNYLIPCKTKHALKKGTNLAESQYVSFDNIINHDGDLVPQDKPTSDPLQIWDPDTFEFTVSNYDNIEVEMPEFWVEYTYSPGPPGQLDPPTKGFEHLDYICLRIGNFKKEAYEITSPVKDVYVFKFSPTKVTVKTNGQEIKINLTRYSNHIPLSYNSIQVKMLPYAAECKFSTQNTVRFPLAINLPEMKQSDLLKGLMQMNGVFAQAKDPNVIDFVSVDDVISNIPRALDWSDKLVNISDNFTVPETIDFNLSGFSQVNICKYDNDDEIPPSSEYRMIVTNQTINDEPNDLITLPFSETVNDANGRAIVPIYKEDTSEAGKFINKDSCGNRILRPKLIGSVYSAGFDGLKWGSLKSKYKGYQAVVANPRVLKVKCLLSDYDLSSLDFAVPVTFKQFGNYYIILKVKSSSSGLSSCEFLEIKTYSEQGLPGYPSASPVV